MNKNKTKGVSNTKGKMIIRTATIRLTELEAFIFKSEKKSSTLPSDLKKCYRCFCPYENLMLKGRVAVKRSLLRNVNGQTHRFQMYFIYLLACMHRTGSWRDGNRPMFNIS